MVEWTTLLIGLLPAFIWLIFFLQEDRKRPEPKGLILSTFLWGGLIAFVALQAQIQFRDLIVPLGIKEFSPFSIFWLAGIEEFFKFLVVFLWVRRRKEFDEPIDAMIYMIVAALGFATIENIASVSQATAGSNLELLTLRFIGATLLHSLSSGLVGFYWARGLVKDHNLFQSIAVGLFIATILHSIFNSLVLAYGPTLIVTTFLIFVAFFVLNDFEKLKKEPLPSPSFRAPARNL
ncbi:MAG: PrsW family intramembrane metalloprotease [Patescibacteria group bacterium]